MFRFTLCVVLAAFVCGIAVAEPASPDEVVRLAVEGVMTSIKAEPSARSGDAAHIESLVQLKFLPYTDFRHTARLAVGAGWKNATSEQQGAIFEQFQLLLVRTYALELTQISDQNLKFQYGAAPVSAGASDVVVKTRMVTSGDDSEIDYRLEHTAQGWKIYDINILGAWLSDLYRNQFAGRLSQGGPDGLIKALKEHNGRTPD